jgi:oligoribonuclease
MSNLLPLGGEIDGVDKHLWLDCEFTGLDPDNGHRILEIGVIVTDLALNELDSYQRFIHGDWDTLSGLMDSNPWWNGRTVDKERMRVGTAAGTPRNEVDADLAALVEAYFSPVKPPVSGNSLGKDRLHIERQLPHFDQRLHYRNADVSSLKEWAKQYFGIEYTAKAHRHYALEDVRESIDEFRFLMRRIAGLEFGDMAVRHTLEP